MKIKLIEFKPGYSPIRSYYNDAGADVKSPETYIIDAHETKKIPLGFGLELPSGYMGFIFPRSGMAARGIVCELPPIDSGYRGEIHAVITNHTDCEIKINKGERVGQLVIVPVIIAEFVWDLGSERGTGAFGSTGA